MPPFAVTLLLPNEILPEELVKLKLPEPRAIVPDVIPPVAVTVIELGVPEIVPRVKALAPCVIVTAPVSVTFNVPTLVFTVVAPLPVVRDNVPVELSEPDPLIVPAPAVATVMPPLAVTVPFTLILLPLLAVTENEPEPSLLPLS